MHCVFCRPAEERVFPSYVTRTFAFGVYRSGELGFWSVGLGWDWIRYALCLLGRSWDFIGLRIRVEVVKGVRDLRNAFGPTRSLDLRHVARYP